MAKDLSFYVAQMCGVVVMQAAAALKRVDEIAEEKDQEIAQLRQQLDAAHGKVRNSHD